MRNAFLGVLCAMACAACSALRPVETSTAAAQQQIASGQLLKPGDKVRLITADGKAHELTVTAIDADGTVEGKPESVRIADIVTVEKRELAVGKTTGLVLGIVIGLQVGEAVGDLFSWQ
jgi:hypothetical protein